MYSWDAERKCVVDYMGFPLTTEDAQHLKDLLVKHLKLHPDTIYRLRSEHMIHRHPKMKEAVDEADKWHGVNGVGGEKDRRK